MRDPASLTLEPQHVDLLRLLPGETRVRAAVDRSDPWAITHLGDDAQSGKGLDGGKFPGGVERGVAGFLSPWRCAMGEPRELMDRATQAVLAGDLDRLREIYAADAVVTTPDAGTLNGIDAFIEWNRGFLDAFSDRDFHTERALETQECAIDQGEFIGTNTQPLQLPDGQSLPPTGKRIRVRSVDVATVQDGRIVRHDFYFDQLDMLSQLGLMEAPGVSES
jgi:ketosteroid isomerase-like protein